MHLISPQAHTRRAFLRRTGQLALAGTAMPFAVNLAAMGEAAAATATDYKALVCVFLYGGNDYANTVVTYDDASYNAYAAIRGADTSIARSALAPTVLRPQNALENGRQYALHPAMKQLADLYNNEGKVAVQLNVGPLVRPLTRAQYAGNDRTNYPIPPKLFSHNDQQSIWQSSSPEGSTVGWGGNIGDLVLGSNSNSLFTCISVSGNAVFMSGDSALQYQVGTSGAISINCIKNSVYGSATVKAAMAQMVQQSRSHAMENEYVRVTSRAVAAEGQINGAKGAEYPNGVPGTPSTFPYGATSSLVYPGVSYTGSNQAASQLAMVAQLIRGRNQLGSKRQVFFVSLGGFDLHDKLMVNHPGLLARLSDAMAAFHREMVVLGVADNVTAFTASDFGRTLASNGDGSDHGWGNHHFVVGGAVNGKARLYGKAPVVSINNDAGKEGYEGHVGQGRLIPGTSVDQYAATLAKWFGVPAAELGGILPNLRNFGSADYPVDLGFMAA